ncbi:hypothetical protein Agub_g11063, partial [Astrephomene gubernaculifera]
GNTGSSRLGKREWERYTRLFEVEDAAVVQKIDEAVSQLGHGLNSTEVVTVICRALKKAIDATFRLERRQGSIPSAGRTDKDAPWWTPECAEAREAMFAQKALMRTNGLLGDQDARAEFSRLRTKYQRLRREAKDKFRVMHFEGVIEECRGDPRALWGRLNGRFSQGCPITDVNSWGAYFNALFNGEVNAFNEVSADTILSTINGVPHGRGRGWVRATGDRVARVTAAAALNVPFTLAEVIAALKSLRNNKSGGLDRVPAECFKCATREVEGRRMFVLAPYLLKLLEHIRSTGDYPVQFEVSALTPIHKKGDVMEKGNYRGLAVGGVLSKLYAFMLEHRLSRWGELVGARSPYQGGFRRKRGTCHNLFLLRHLTDKHKGGRDAVDPLFVCQIDFEKAFDKVPRDLLWLRLEERGVHGAMLEALKTCYNKVMMRVRVDGVTGDPFESSQGVKQGCPLSPTLYGIFGEGFADYVDAKDKWLPDAMRAKQQTPHADGRRIPLELYADDLSLFATTHRRLIVLLADLREWCEAFGMRVNVRKCELMVFHPRANIREAFAALCPVVWTSIEGNARVPMVIPWVQRARYLGLHFGPGTPFVSCTEELLTSGRRAMFSLQRKLKRLGLLVPAVAVKCFDVQVRSILSYGVQVWGPDVVLKLMTDCENSARYFDRSLRDPMVQLQREFLREIAGVKVSPDKLLFKEFNQRPLHVFWLELFLRFWNDLVKQKDTVYHQALRGEIRSALSTEHYDGWGSKVLKILKMLGTDLTALGGELDLNARVERIAGTELNVSALTKKFADRMDADWEDRSLEDDPRLFNPVDPVPGVGVKMCRYKNWMGDPVDRGYITQRQHVNLMRFRLCVW